MSEHDLQVACFDWLDIKAQQDDRYNDFYAIKNEGKRPASQVVNFKRAGMKPGFSDIIVLVAAHGYHGALCELKMPGNEPTALQEKFLARARKRKYFTTVIDNFPHFQEFAEWYIEAPYWAKPNQEERA